MSGSVSLVNGHIDPDKKRITDKQIIQALNTATNVDGLQICCIDYENNPKNVIYLSIKSDILDLINRQQAELEDARIGVKSYKGKYESAVKTAKELQTLVDEQQAEIERLKNCVKSEDEVMDIAKRTMEPLVKEITREQIDIAVKLAKAEAEQKLKEMRGV